MHDVKELKALLGKLVGQLESVVQYADALYIENRALTFEKDRTGVNTHSGADAGVKVRAFDGMQYHEVCIAGWQPALLQQEVQSLISRLKAKPAGKAMTLKLERDVKDRDFTTEAIIDPTTVLAEQKTAAIASIYDQVMTQSDQFINCEVVYKEREERRVFVNRYKKLSSRWTGCNLIIMPFMRAPDGQTRYDYYGQFRHGFEVTKLDPAKLKEFIGRALKVRTAGRITPGKYTAVLSPNVTGLLAHESFGHGMESDMIMRGRAKAEEFLGKRIAPAKVNICDDPSLPGTHGSLFFDDEGVLPERTFMVRSGVVTAPITESYSASKRGFARTANGRAESYDHKVYARMTNTFFLQGKDDPKMMIKGVKNGLYLHHATSGMEDPKGWGVQIAGVLCERIKNGKLTGETFYEATITGYLPKILGNIAAVGKDFSIHDDAGYCSKGHKEVVRVSSGGPHLLIKELDLT